MNVVRAISGLLLAATLIAAPTEAAFARLAPLAPTAPPPPVALQQPPAPAVTSAERNYFVAPSYVRCQSAAKRADLWPSSVECE